MLNAATTRRVLRQAGRKKSLAARVDQACH